MKKRILSVLLCTTMVASMLAGCGSAAEAPAAAPAAEAKEEAKEEAPAAETKEEAPAAEASEEEQITITIWHQSVADTDPVKKIIEASVDEYHELHPNITIEQDGVEGEQYKTKIKTAFAAGEAPDLSYMWAGSFVKPFVDAGYLLPIDDYMNPDVKAKVLPGMLAGSTFDGKVYSYPTITFLADLYCNKEQFDAAGAKIPETWDELLDAIDKLKAAGYNPIMMGEKDLWPGMYWMDIISQRCAGNAGVEAAFGDPTKFNSPEFVEAATRLQELVQAGGFNENYLSTSYTEMVEGFCAGQGAMLYQANWVHPAIMDDAAATKGKVVCVPFPEIPGTKGNKSEFSGGSSDGYYVNAATEHPKEVVEYLEYLSEKIGTLGFQMGAGLACWDTSSTDLSALTSLDQESAALMEQGTSYIGWWDNVLSAEDSDTYKQLVAEVMAMKITPEEYAEKMSKLSPSEFY